MSGLVKRSIFGSGTDCRQVALDSFLRRRSFLEDAGWHSLPWKRTQGKDLVDHALDVIICVPGLLEKADKARAGEETYVDLQSDVARLVDSLHTWKVQHLDTYCLNHIGTPFDLDSLDRSIIDGSLADVALARAIVLHLSTWLFLTRLGQSDLLPWPVEDVVSYVLDVCEIYSYSRDGSGIMAWTFSLRVALFTRFDENSLCRARGLSARFKDRYSVDLLSDIIDSLPGHNGKLQFQGAEHNQGQGDEMPD